MRHTLVALIFIPAPGLCSEALVYAAAYECNAVAMNEALVELCALQPGLAERSRAAYERWFQRNATAAEAKRHHCAMAPIRERVTQLQSEMMESFKAKLASQGIHVCESALSQLESGEGGVDIK